MTLRRLRDALLTLFEFAVLGVTVWVVILILLGLSPHP